LGINHQVIIINALLDSIKVLIILSAFHGNLIFLTHFNI